MSEGIEDDVGGDVAVIVNIEAACGEVGQEEVDVGAFEVVELLHDLLGQRGVLQGGHLVGGVDSFLIGDQLGDEPLDGCTFSVGVVQIDQRWGCAADATGGIAGVAVGHGRMEDFGKALQGGVFLAQGINLRNRSWQ